MPINAMPAANNAGSTMIVRGKTPCAARDGFQRNTLACHRSAERVKITGVAAVISPADKRESQQPRHDRDCPVGAERR
jgi:hypothetical protein